MDAGVFFLFDFLYNYCIIEKVSHFPSGENNERN